MAASKEQQREKARERQRRWAAKNPGYKRERYARDPNVRAANKESARRWREEHPEEHEAYQRAYAEANRDAKRERSRMWRTANAERARASDRKRYANDPARAANVMARVKAWVKANPDAARTHGATRRARVRGAFVEHVHPLIVLERDDGACGICGSDVDPLNFHIDHIIPVARGGEHSYANVQTAHPECNLKKWAHDGD